MMKRIKGFTLVEVVIVMVLLGIVANMVAPLIFQGAQGTNEAETLDELDWKAREGLERLSRELRSVNPKLISGLSGSSNLTFTNNAGQSVALAYSGSTVTRNGTALMTDVSAFAFSYYTGAGTVTGAGPNVRLIQFAATFTLDGHTSPNYVTAVGLTP